MVFLKEFLKKSYLEKNQQAIKKQTCNITQQPELTLSQLGMVKKVAFGPIDFKRNGKTKWTILKKATQMWDDNTSNLSYSGFQCQEAQWLSAWLQTKGQRVSASPASPCCVFEQDTFILALYWFNQGRPVPTWLKNCLLGCKESNETKVFNITKNCSFGYSGCIWIKLILRFSNMV